MTAPVLAPVCPGCSAPLDSAPCCGACGLRLVGADAARLWQVDVRLAALDGEASALRVERGALLRSLRGAAPAPDVLPGQPVRARSALAVPPSDPAPSTAPRAETQPRSVQNTLLALGALLLGTAATVFAAVTYDRLGAGGRAAVLLALTVVAALVVPVLVRRRLTASAEAVATVVLALCALDAYGLRTLGLGDDLPGATYAGVAAGVLALLCGAAAVAVPLRLPRVASAVLAQLPVPLLLVGADASAGAAGLALVALAAADLLVVDRARSRLAEVAPVLCVSAATVAVAGLLAALAAAYGQQVSTGALAFAAAAALAAGAAWRTTGAARLLLAAAPAVLVATAAHALVAPDLTSLQEPLVAAAVGLLAALVAAQLPASHRPGALLGAGAVTLVALVTQAEPVVEALARPLVWLLEPWTLDVTGAREALSPDRAWSGTVVTLVVLAAAALVCATAGLALRRSARSGPATAALVVAAIVVLPLGLATSHAVALALLLGFAAALLGVGALLDLPAAVRGPLLAAGGGIALLAAVWSTADQTTTLVVLPAIATLAGAVACRPLGATTVGAATAVGALAAGAALASGGAAGDLAADQVGGLLVLAPATLIAAAAALARSRPARADDGAPSAADDPVAVGAVTAALRAARRTGLEVAAVVLATTCVVLTAGDPGWLSWTLVGLGLVALATALQPDRRVVGVLGGLLLAASSWVRLADAGVGAPEPYVVPAGLVALVVGHLRRRTDRSASSALAYGPGLSLCLVPSLVAALGDDELTRSLVLLAVGIGVLLVGARSRLQAPLVAGAAVVAVDALHLLGPYAAALPRWMPLAAAGLLLVALGATYEQRRRDLSQLRERFATLG